MRTLLPCIAAVFAVACHGATSSAPPAAPEASTPAAVAPVAAAPAVTAPAAASPAPSGPGTISLADGASGYLATPKGPGKHPAILVIQEWWGVTDWIKQDADRFAAQGYVALAVDLYRGKSTSSPDEAHELMRGLPEDRGLGDIQAGFDALAKRDDVDPARIGIVGWCMGGGYSLDFAIKEPRLRAAVINYGHLASDAKASTIKAALLGQFGGKDRGIPAADVKGLAATLKSKGKDVDFKVYDDAGHAFMNPNNKEGYNEADAKDAWSRIDAFFTRTLGGK